MEAPLRECQLAYLKAQGSHTEEKYHKWTDQEVKQLLSAAMSMHKDWDAIQN